MVKEINWVLKDISSEFSENDIEKIFLKYSLNLASVLKNKKANIGNNLKNKNWDKIQKEFEETFQA